MFGAFRYEHNPDFGAINKNNELRIVDLCILLHALQKIGRK